MLRALLFCAPKPLSPPESQTLPRQTLPRQTPQHRTEARWSDASLKQEGTDDPWSNDCFKG